MSKSTKLKIKPLGDRVLVRELKSSEERKTASGIILPGSADEDRGAKKGEIVAIGEGRYEEGKIVPMKVKEGDQVLFQWGDVVVIDREEYTIVSEANIIGIIK